MGNMRFFKNNSIAKAFLICLLILSLIGCMAGCNQKTDADAPVRQSEGWAEKSFRKQMADASVTEVVISDPLVLASPVEVAGNKVISGEASITAIAKNMEGDYMFVVPSGNSLTVKGSVTIDAAGVMGGVHIQKDATWTLEENATVKNASAKAANALVEGKLLLNGGTLADANGHNIYNKNETVISGGTITGSGEQFAGVYNEGKLTQDDGSICAAYYNVVSVDGSSYTFNKGSVADSVNNAIVIEKGASLKITSKDASITGAGYRGIYLSGEAVIDQVSMKNSYDTLIKVTKTGKLTVNDGTLSDAGYHGIDNAGTLLVNGGTIYNSYSCGIVNTGSLEMTGGSVMNNPNKGIVNKLNGVAKITSENVYLAGNMFAIGNEDEAYFELTAATFSGSTNANIYAYGGEMYIHDIKLAKSASNNVRVVAAKVTMENVEIQGNATTGSSTMHGLLLEGGSVEAKNLTIIGTTGNGIRNKGGKFVGTNVALRSIGNHGVTNTNQDFTGREGVIIIDGLTVETVRYNNILSENGTMTLTNAVLTESGTNNIKVSGGTLNLVNVDIQGNTAEAADNVHGIYTTGGTINGTAVRISNTRGAALRVDGDEALVNIKGFTAEALNHASVSLTKGTVSITDGVVGKTDSNNIRIDGGALTLKNVTVNGHFEGSANNIHGVYATGGKLVAEDLTVAASSGAGIRSSGGNVQITGLKVDNVGTHTLYITNNKSVVTVTNAALGVAPSNNVVVTAGELTLTDSEILGQVEGTATNVHGILTGGGKVNLETVTITGTSGSGIRNKGAILNGTDVVIENFGGYNALSNAASDSGLCGELNVDGLTVSGSLNENSDLVILSSQCDGKVNISNAKFTPNTETVKAFANVVVDAGTVVLDNIQMEVVTSNSVRVNGGNVTLTNSTIPGHVEGSANNVNAFYTVGGTTHLENITITNPTGDGLRVNLTADEEGKVTAEPTVTAKNITVSGAGRNSVWVSGGELTVDGAAFSGLKSNLNNVLVSGGKATLINVVSDKVNKNNNICVNGGEMVLQDVQILGHNEGAGTSNHGVYANGGKLTADGLVIQNCAGSGIRVDNDTVVDAKDVKISVTGQHGIRLGDVGEEASNDLKVTINGLTIENTTTNNILHENGELTVKNAVLHESTSNNIKLIGGKLNLENVQVLGHKAGVRNDNHGIFVEITKNSNATLNAKDILVSNTAGAALRNKGGAVKVDGLVLNTIGAATLISNVDWNSVPAVMTLSRVGISEGCEHATYAVHNQISDTKLAGTITNELTVKDSIMPLGSKTIGIYVEYGKATVENSVITGAVYAIQNKAELTVNGGSLHNNGWSVRNEEGAKATLSGGFYYGNKEGTLPSDIYNGGDLTIEDITVGYNKKGNGRPCVIYQAATATPITMKGKTMGLHEASKKLQLAAEEWVQKWGPDKNIIINCDSVADALEAERFFDPGIENPKMFVSAVGSNLELTTQPGGNYIVQIGTERFESFKDALAYIAENDAFDTTAGGFKKAATIQIIDSYLHFENVVIPEDYNITLVDDGTGEHTVAYDSRLTGDMFTVGDGAQLNLKVTGNTNPASGLIFSGSKNTDAAVFCVDGGVIILESDLNITNAYYGIRLVDGEFNAAGKTINTAGTYGIHAIGGELYDATLKGNSSAAVYVGEANADAVLNNITINGYTDGIRSTAGKLTVTDLTVNNPATSGIYLTGNGGNVTVNNLNVVDADQTDSATFAHGIKIESGEITVNGGSIDKTSARSIRTYAGAIVNLTGDVTLAGSTGGDAIYVEDATLNVGAGKLTISSASAHGIYANGASAKVNISGDVSIANVNYAILTNGGGSLNAVDGTKITISDSNYGLVSWSNSVISLDEVDISGVKYNSIYVDGNSNTDAARTGVTVKRGTIGTTEDAFNIYVFEDGKLNLSNATVTHTSAVEWPHGNTDKINAPVHVMGNSKVTLDNVTLNGGKYGIRVHTSKNVTLNNVTIKDSTQFGMWLQASPLVTVTGDLKISNTGSNGIQVNSGTLDASNATKVEITDPGRRGIEIGGTANMHNLTITNAADSGIYVNGKVVLTGTASVTNSAKDGIYVAAGKELDASAVTSMLVDTTANDANGISNYGTFTAQHLTVQNTAGSGIQNYANANMTITNLTTSGMKKWHGLKNMGTVTINGATIGKSPSNNLVADSGTMNLNGIITINGTNSNNTLQLNNSAVVNLNGTLNISGAAADGIEANTNSVFTTTDASEVVISGGNYGVAASANAELTIAKMTTSGVKTRSILVSDTASVTVKSGTFGTTEDAMNIEVLNNGTLNLSNATVTHTSTVEWPHGNTDKINAPVHVYGDGTVTLDNVTLNGGKYGIRVHTSKNVTLNNVTIKDSTAHGVWLQNSPLVTVTGELKISKTGDRGVQVNSGTFDATNATKIEIIDAAGIGIENHGTTVTNNLSITTTKTDATHAHNVKTSGTITLNGTTVLGQSNSQNLLVEGANAKVILNGTVTIGGTDTNNGLRVINGGSAEVNGSLTIQGIAAAAIDVESGTLTATGANAAITVRDSKNGLYVISGATVNIRDLNIYDVTEYGVQVGKGNCTVADLHIEGAKIGVYANNADSVVEIGNLETVDVTQKSAFIDSGANLTINGGTLCRNSDHNVQVNGTSVLNIKDVTFGGTQTYAALRIKGGTVTASNLTFGAGDQTAIQVDGGETTIDGLTVSGVTGNAINIYGGKLTVKNATLGNTGANHVVSNTAGELILENVTIANTPTAAGKYEIYCTSGNMKVTGEINADIFFASAAALNVVGGLADGSDITLNWADGKLPTDHVAVNFVDANGAKDETGMNACKTAGYIKLAAPALDNYSLYYMATTDKTCAMLAPEFVMSQDDLNAVLAIAKYEGKTEAEAKVGGSFTISQQVAIPSGIASVIIKDKDAADSEKYAITAASGVSPFAIADGQKLTVKDLTVGGANADAPASQIRVGTGAQLDLQNVTMQYFSNSHGAAIFVYDTGKLTASDSTFANNKNNTNWGGAIANWGGTVEITDSVFRGNYSKNSGGAIFNYHDDGQNGAPNLGRKGSVTVTGCTFLNNTSDANGGALGMYGKGNTMNVVNCTFGELDGSNAVVNSNTAPNGDAILAQDGSTLTVYGGSFYGDDIFVRGNKNSEGVANLEGTINMIGAQTNAIQVATVSGSDVFGCTVNIKGTLNIIDPGTNGIFIDGKGIVNHTGVLTVSDDVANTNATAPIFAQKEGKFVGVDGSTVTTSGTGIYNNIYSTGSAEVTVYGGTFGATTQNNIVAISGGTVKLYGNATQNTKVTGGNHGVLADSNGKITLEHVTISNSGDGGIRANSAGSVVNASNVTIDDAKIGLSVSQGSITIEDLTIEDSGKNGMQVSGGTVTINGLEIKNSAARAISIYGGTMTVKNAVLKNAGAYEIIRYVDNGTLNLENVTIGNTPSATGMHQVYTNWSDLNLSGEINAEIYYDAAKTLNVTGNLTGDVTVDWASGKAPTGTAISFASEDVMNASMSKITLGDVQSDAGNLLYFHMDGTNAVATLVNKVVTSEAELNDYLAASAYYGTSAEVLIGGNFTVANQVVIPAQLTNVTIKDDGDTATGNTVTYIGTATGSVISWDEDTALSLSDIIIDGSNVGNITVSADSVLKTNNVTLQNVYNRGLDIYGTVNASGGLIVDSVTTGNKYAIVVEGGGKLVADTGSVVTVNDANYGVVGYSTGAISLDRLKTGSGSIANSALWANGSNVVSVNYAEITAKGDAVYASGTVNMTIETLNVSNSNKNINAIDNAHVTVNGGTLGKSTSNNVTSGGAGSVVTLKNVSVNGATNASTHGVLAQDGDVVLENVTITSATGTDGAGIRVNRAGSNVTVTGKLEITDVAYAISISAGEVDITGVKDTGGANSVELSANTKNIVMDGGTVKVTNATLNATSNHNVHPRNNAATVTLTDCEILGGGQYGVLAENGHAVLNRVSFSGCKDAIRANQATSTVVATDVTISNSTRYGISISNGEITLNGATITNSAYHDIYVENTNGTMNIGGKVQAEVYFNVADVLNVTSALTDSITVDWATAPAGTAISFKDAATLTASRGYITLGATQAAAGKTLAYGETDATLVAFTEITSWADLSTAVSALIDGDKAFYKVTGDSANWAASSSLAIPSGVEVTLIGDANSPAIVASTGVSPFTLASGSVLTLNNLTVGGTESAKAAGIDVVNGAKLYLVDTTLQHMTADRGGAVLVWYGGELTAVESTFYKNTATNYGGAVGNWGGDTVLADCVFDSNQAPSGGAILNYKDDANAGGTNNVGTFTCEGCDFVSNKTTTAVGGAIGLYASGSSTITDCVFGDVNDSTKANTAATSGGAIYLQDSHKATITGSKFYSNSAKNGGAIYTKSSGVSTATDCEFVKNTTTEYGGAIAAWGGKINLYDCSFDQNAAVKSGGAILNYSNGIANVSDSSFSNNTATENGGAIAYWDKGSSMVTNCEFTNNSAVKGGAIHLKESNTTVTISGSTFTENSSTGIGGAICTESGTVLNIDNTAGACVFSENSGTEGGAISASGNITASGAKFEKNKSTTARGGAVIVWNTVTAAFTSCEYTDNTATTQGGAVTKGGSAGGVLTITDCTFASNTALAGEGAGALMLQSSPSVTISGSTFIENHANEHGGAIKNNSSTTALKITDSIFMRNTADGDGGAIYNQASGTYYVSGCTFTDNDAVGNGDAIRNAGGTVNLSGGCSFNGATDPATGQISGTYSIAQ